VTDPADKADDNDATGGPFFCWFSSFFGCSRRESATDPADDTDATGGLFFCWFSSLFFVVADARARQTQPRKPTTPTQLADPFFVGSPDFFVVADARSRQTQPTKTTTPMQLEHPFFVGSPYFFG